MELLSRLRSAVKKLTFLLQFKKYIRQSSWQFASLIARVRAPAAVISGHRWRRRVLSFNDRPGLRACVELDAPEHDHHQGDYDGADDEVDESVRSEGSSGATSPAEVLRRTTSWPSPNSDEDVDKRAENFIAWFRGQLNYERQISLDLRYCRRNSFDDSSSSNDTNVSPLSS